MQADCVRIFAVQLTQDGYGYRYLQLAEIEAYAGTHKIQPSGVAVSTVLDTWPKERLIDGDTSTVWSSYGHADHLADAEWAALLLPNSSTIDRIRIYPLCQRQGHRRLSQGLRAALLQKQQRSHL